MSLIVNQAKYGYIKAASFIIGQLNQGWKRKKQTCIQYITKKKSAIAERFIRTIKGKIYKYMTSLSKSVYIDKSDDIVNKYNNTYH